MKKNSKNTKYKNISEFKDGETYLTTHGNSVLIHGITEDKVRFVINNQVQDMQSHKNFLNFMNGGKYSILNF